MLRLHSHETASVCFIESVVLQAKKQIKTRIKTGKIIQPFMYTKNTSHFCTNKKNFVETLDNNKKNNRKENQKEKKELLQKNRGKTEALFHGFMSFTDVYTDSV